MRVTFKMNVDNMILWMSRRAEMLYQAETVVGYGKKVNRPSDDPMAAGKILADRTHISKYGQYLSNIDHAQTWIALNSSTLETVYGLLSTGIDAVVEGATGDLSTRNELHDTLESIYGQVVDLANGQYRSGFMYSGHQTGVRPFSHTTQITGGAAEDIVFDLAEDAANIEVEITNQAGEVVRTITVAGGTAGTNSIAWDGLDNGGIPLADGEYDFTVSATDAAGRPVGTCHTYRGDDGEKQFIIDDNSVVSCNTDGGSIFHDALLALSMAMAALETEPYEPAALEDLIDDLKAAADIVQNENIELATQNTRLETTKDRLNLSLLHLESSLKETEACDPNWASAVLLSQQTAYQLTMETAAKILNMPSLISKL